MAGKRVGRWALLVLVVAPAALVAGAGLIVGAVADIVGGRSDQGSPPTADDAGWAGAGVAAIVVLAVWWWATRKPPVLPVVAVSALAVVICTVPLWKRYNTVDVTASGFRRAEYTFSWTFRVWNGAGHRVRVCVGDTGRCAEGRRALVLEPGQRGSVEDTGGVGRYTLTIVEPGRWARRDARVTIEEPDPDDEPYQPGVPAQPYVPPPPVPPPYVPMVPYR
ncbi:hypothetical protein [Cryptosporangium japonicum]|uniref:Uncharacterized protein n=1 Tax=Cryptosporangium japonicum TaxID=80872 RepID=A0ABN0UE87_9ACTN